VAAIRVSAFEDVTMFKRRVDAAIRQIHECKRAPGVERIYVPGEVEFITKERYMREGIPLNLVTRQEMARAAASLGAHGANILRLEGI
jgi:LDH2 family malate/lactate/ureidoglycolate dehydrogenase